MQEYLSTTDLSEPLLPKYSKQTTHWSWWLLRAHTKLNSLRPFQSLSTSAIYSSRSIAHHKSTSLHYTPALMNLPPARHPRAGQVPHKRFSELTDTNAHLWLLNSKSTFRNQRGRFFLSKLLTPLSRWSLPLLAFQPNSGHSSNLTFILMSVVAAYISLLLTDCAFLKGTDHVHLSSSSQCPAMAETNWKPDNLFTK